MKKVRAAEVFEVFSTVWAQRHQCTPVSAGQTFRFSAVGSVRHSGLVMSLPRTDLLRCCAVEARRSDRVRSLKGFATWKFNAKATSGVGLRIGKWPCRRGPGTTCEWALQQLAAAWTDGEISSGLRSWLQGAHDAPAGHRQVFSRPPATFAIC